MEAIRKFIKVEGKTINITLPDDFYANEVEVIILPKGDYFNLTDEMVAELDQQLNEPASDYISAEESIAELKQYANSIPEWQKQQVRERTKNYEKDPSTALDFDEVIKKIEDGL